MSRLTDNEKFYAVMGAALGFCVILVFWQSFLMTSALLALPFTLWWLNDRREQQRPNPRAAGKRLRRR